MTNAYKILLVKHGGEKNHFQDTGVHGTVSVDTP
jgi:hypothetical protein